MGEHRPCLLETVVLVSQRHKPGFETSLPAKAGPRRGVAARALTITVSRGLAFANGLRHT